MLSPLGRQFAPVPRATLGCHRLLRSSLWRWSSVWSSSQRSTSLRRYRRTLPTLMARGPSPRLRHAYRVALGLPSHRATWSTVSRGSGSRPRSELVISTPVPGHTAGHFCGSLPTGVRGKFAKVPRRQVCRRRRRAGIATRDRSVAFPGHCGSCVGVARSDRRGSRANSATSGLVAKSARPGGTPD